ncbi:lipoxygenase homology domain-containing protein 1 [Exaiptasia diaphana]|uniref:PLAT domain-containing protein n=1 Tax=Exaiptasia diaphana TaxID=2652724 RepID=A0A913XBJ7_EXADI|nr:lipoxygenase homology domain-containing protein 1 [Exaiptasia diaphana]
MLSILAFCVLVLSPISLSAGFRYHVDTKTGNKLGASTDSDIFIKIVGNKGATGTHELASSGDDFESGNLDSFVINDSTDIGVPRTIRIYRTSTFLGNWYLEWVRVNYNEKQYLFRYNSWVPGRKWIDIEK